MNAACAAFVHAGYVKAMEAKRTTVDSGLPPEAPSDAKAAQG